MVDTDPGVGSEHPENLNHEYMPGEFDEQYWHEAMLRIAFNRQIERVLSGEEFYSNLEAIHHTIYSGVRDLTGWLGYELPTYEDLIAENAQLYSGEVIFDPLITPGGIGGIGGGGSGGRVVYPRGPGASTGPVPGGYVPVSRWINQAEADAWIANGGTTIPGGIGGETGRVYVTMPGAPKPGGTGPIRVDFYVRADSLNVAGKSDWYQIMQPASNMPIYNVSIHYTAP